MALTCSTRPRVRMAAEVWVPLAVIELERHVELLEAGVGQQLAGQGRPPCSHVARSASTNSSALALTSPAARDMRESCGWGASCARSRARACAPASPMRSRPP